MGLGAGQQKCETSKTTRLCLDWSSVITMSVFDFSRSAAALFSSPEPPVTVVRKLEDQKVADGAVISIECELSRHNVDVKWTKASSTFLPFWGL